MSSHTSRVRINMDNAQRISELYGIGSELAGRIILYRKKNGYFRTPEDLAKVEGVKLQLALTLAPHIDWNEPTPKRTFDAYLWFIVPIVSFLMVLLFGYFILDQINSIKLLLLYYQAGYHQVFRVIISSAIAIFLMMNFGVIGFIVLVIKRLPKINQKRIAFQILWVAILVALMGGLYIFLDTEIILYQYDGWYGLIHAPATIASIALIVIGLPLGIPLILVFWNPQNIANIRLARIFDLAISLVSIAAAITIWAFGKYFSVWINFLGLCAGILVSIVGLALLRTKKSYFRIIIDQFVPLENLRKINEDNDWRYWINARLPNPEEQKALKKALDEVYPSSKFRKIISAITIGGGGWLIATSAGGIIQWFIEKGLDKWLGKLFSK